MERLRKEEALQKAANEAKRKAQEVALRRNERIQLELEELQRRSEPRKATKWRSSEPLLTSPNHDRGER